MRELLEFRLGIEPTAASLAAERISDSDARALLASGNDMNSAMELGDRHAFFSADAVFHRLLLQGSGNAVIAQFADTVQAALHSRTRDARPESAELNLISMQRHMDLANAVVDRDPVAAAAMARTIIEETLLEFNAD